MTTPRDGLPDAGVALTRRVRASTFIRTGHRRQDCTGAADEQFMRILHLADVHLDRPFVGLGRDSARARRSGLFDTFRRALDAAEAHEVDVVTIGGDLWEDENVTADTRASVAHLLGQVGRPVVIVAGNHDPYLRGGHFARTEWPENVHVVDGADPREVYAGDHAVVWGVSWTERPLTSAFLASFQAPDDGRTKLLLLHGTAQDSRWADGNHCSFDPRGVRAAGFAAVLCGHIHGASFRDGVIYPGSLEPLDHTEIGRHCYAIVEVDDGRVEVELVDVNQRRFVSETVDCTDAASSVEIQARARAVVPAEHAASTVIRMELVGEVAEDCEIDCEALARPFEDAFAGVVIIDRTDVPVDVDDLAERQTADGIFVRAMRETIDSAADERERAIAQLALRAGVRAMQGKGEILSVD